MRNMKESLPWAAAWLAAASLALLLFGVMSLVALRSVRTPQDMLGTIAPITPAGVTPGAGVSGSSGAAENSTPQPEDLPAANSSADGSAPDPTAAIGLWLSAISAITALIGLVSSLWLGWRKERREVAQFQVELERTRLEVAKLRRELEERQTPNAGPDAA